MSLQSFLNLFRRIYDQPPTITSLSLAPCMQSLLSFLDEVDRHPSLYTNNRILTQALHRYEKVWVPLLTLLPPSQRTAILPPLDVHWVWFCHLLNPRQYIQDSASMWNAAGGTEEDYIIDHYLHPVNTISEARLIGQQLWQQHFPKVPFHLDHLHSAPMEDNTYTSSLQKTITTSVIKYDIRLAASRQMLFHYQVSLPHYKQDPDFLNAAVKRYEKFLYLGKLFPQQQLAPTYDIDLAWHAHMAHPRVYKVDTEEMCGRHFPHDDTINDRVQGGKLDTIWRATTRLWWKKYGECIGKDGGMWRGNVDFEERRLREVLERERLQIADMLKPKTQLFVEETQDVMTMTQKKAWESVDWVHAREYLQKNDAGMETCELTRWTSVEEMMTARAIHVMTARRKEGNKLAQAIGFLSLIEVFKINGTGYPMASVNIYHETPIGLPYTPIETVIQAAGRQTLLLRVCGQDLALLNGLWNDLEGLELMILFVKDSKPEWIKIESSRTVDEDMTRPRMYEVSIPVVDNDRGKDRKSVRFDLATGMISAECTSLMVHAYLLCLAAGVLHVRTQRKYVPRNGESMYGERDVDQSRFTVLRGAGGERRKDEKEGELEGYWWMRTYGNGCSINGFGEERSGFAPSSKS